jgi:hypothetical protein
LKRLSTLLAVATLVGSGMLAPAAAHAASLDVSCFGEEMAGYQPGLRLLPQQTNVTVNGDLAVCDSANASVVSGSYLQNFDATLSCSTLLAGLSATRVFHWSDGRTSTFSYNRTITDVGGETTVTFVGSIVSGEFAGDTAVEQVVFATLNTIQCLVAPGLSQLGPGVAVLTIAQA